MLPEQFEPFLRQLSAAHRVLDIFVPEVVLRRSIANPRGRLDRGAAATVYCSERGTDWRRHEPESQRSNSRRRTAPRRDCGQCFTLKLRAVATRRCSQVRRDQLR